MLISLVLEGLNSTYIEYQSISPVVRIGSPRTLSPASECAPPPLKPRGWGNTRLRLMGRGEPIRTTGEKACHSVYSVTFVPVLFYRCTVWKSTRSSSGLYSRPRVVVTSRSADIHRGIVDAFKPTRYHLLCEISR